MEQQSKELTKQLLANALKELMRTVPFEKITIKMITDRAGVIRPTFYNHFQDKYDLLGWIADTELIAKMRVLFEGDMFSEAMRYAFTAVGQERAFYAKAFGVEGQNGFSGQLTALLRELFTARIGAAGGCAAALPAPLSAELAATHYALNLCAALHLFADRGEGYPAEQAVNAWMWLMDHPLRDLLDGQN